LEIIQPNFWARQEIFLLLELSSESDRLRVAQGIGTSVSGRLLSQPKPEILSAICRLACALGTGGNSNGSLAPIRLSSR
jgi:hypothetical protein